MKKSLLIIVFFASSLFLTWCNILEQTSSCGTGNVCTLPTTGNQQTISSGQQTSLTGVAEQTIQAIKNKEFATLADLASTNGVRFSPYENIHTGSDIVLSTQQLTNALSISAAYTRGNYDGSGEPISLWIGQYRAKFVYDVDFANAPSQLRNQPQQRGNTINNIFTVYTGKQIIEYHFTGSDPQYQGMDWKSLRLVFWQENNQWKLIGVVHGQRSI